MKRVQKEEHRTRSELLREAWRHYFESRYGVYKPTRAETAAVKHGREAFKRGEYLTLGELHHDLDATRQQARKKRSRRAS